MQAKKGLEVTKVGDDMWQIDEKKLKDFLKRNPIVMKEYIEERFESYFKGLIVITDPQKTKNSLLEYLINK